METAQKKATCDVNRFVSGLFHDRPQVAWELIVEEINRYMKVNR